MLPDSHPLKLAPFTATGARAGTKRLVIVDRNVDDLWGVQIRHYFAVHGVDAQVVVLPTWEDNKTFDLVFKVAEEIENAKLKRRKEPVIAIGGGVCLDICGLAANLYRRNTPIIKACLCSCRLHFRPHRFGDYFCACIAAAMRNVEWHMLMYQLRLHLPRTHT